MLDRLGHDSKVVSWNNNNRRAFADVVTKTEPKDTPTKERKLSKRQQMVNKSCWTFTEDFDLKTYHRNPDYDDAYRGFIRANPQPSPWVNIQGLSYHVRSLGTSEVRKYNEAVNDYNVKVRDFYENVLNKIPEHIEKLTRSFKAGDTFTINGKLMSWNTLNYKFADNDTQIIRADVNGDDVYLPYNSVVGIIEPVAIPTVYVYALRDKTTGKFYKPGGYMNQFKPQWVDVYNKGKLFDNLGRAKTHVLTATGYYNGLNDDGASLPEWMDHGGTGLEINENIDLVKFDKLARKEVEVVAEFIEWYKRAWELRELTVKYGSSVRTVYKELEKKDMLDKQKIVLVFTASEDDIEEYCNEGESAIREDDRKWFEESVEAAGLKKGTYKKAIDHKSFAISFADKSKALMFKLSYGGGLKSTIIDINEMKEVVEK